MTDPKILAEVLLQKHWPKFGGFIRPCIYRAMNNAAYDPSAGNATELEISSQPDVPIIFDMPGSVYKSLTDNAEVQQIDRVALVPSLDLNVKPTVKDQIIDPDLTVWVVEAVGDDPGPAHWEILVRPRKMTEQEYECFCGFGSRGMGT